MKPDTQNPDAALLRPLLGHESRVAGMTMPLSSAADSVVTEATTATTAVWQQQRLEILLQALEALDYQVASPLGLARLYQETCRVFVDSGGFALAWVAHLNEQTGALEPLEAHGATGYLDVIISDHGLDVRHGQAPCAVAWREQRLVVCNDIEALANSTEVGAVWLQRALQARLAALIALPLMREGRVLAVLAAYAKRPDSINAEIVRLCENLADNLVLAQEYAHREAHAAELLQRLQQSEERFRTLIENLPMKVFVKDADDVYAVCNSRFAQGFGLLPEELVGKCDDDLYPAELASRFRLEDQIVRLGGKGLSMLEHVPHRQNHHAGIADIDNPDESAGGFAAGKVVRISKSAYRDDRNEIVGVLGFISDVTERKQAELRLLQFAHEVEDIYQHAPCGYHSIDAQGRLLRINATELAWLGYSREEMMAGVQFVDLLADSCRQEYLQFWDELKGHARPQNIELDMVRKDGCLLPVSLQATAMFDDEGRFAYSRNAVSDISERRELERAQRMHAQHLQRLSHRLVAVQEEERRRLASDLHDHVGPNLVALKITLGNLLHQLPGAEMAGQQAVVEDITALLEDTEARIREICTELRPPLLDYTGLVPALQAYVQQLEGRTGLLIRLDVSQWQLHLDQEMESLLFRIAQEALANCVKHASAQRVDVVLSSFGERVHLEIRDDGIGFVPQQPGQGQGAERATAAERAPGVASPGLGLMTMRERAEFVGGRLTLRSQPGQGTAIFVDVPSQWQSSHLARRATDRKRPVGTQAVARRYAEAYQERRSGHARRGGDGASLSRSTRSGADFTERRASPGRRHADQAYLAAQVIGPM